jgi:eukaryotic-like serine/threonine-protein kinase
METPRSQFGAYDAAVQPPPALPRRSDRPDLNAVGSVVSRQAQELKALLRRRLLISAAVCVGFFGLLPIGSYLTVFAPDVPAAARVVLLSQAGVALIIAAIGLILWRRPPRRLRYLRALELVIFGVVVAYLVLSNGYFVYRYGIMAPPIPPVRHPLIAMDATRLDGVTLRWFTIIVGYGTLIPNTWRRCATIVFVMVGIHLVQLFAQAIWAGVSAGEMTSLFLYPIVWMTVATIVAIFGSYRVSLLERRVQEAERLGQYRLKRFLGQGGMGDVYLGEHVLLKQPFAVKLLRPERIADERVLKRFEAEVHAMAKLQHWNTVEIYDYGHAPDGSFYYVMEYLPGLTLDQIVSRHGPLSSGRTIRMLLQVCNALNEAHSMGLTHRDIKPGNIIVTERAGIYDVAKLLDFGLVKSVENSDSRLTMEGTIAGTPAYMSPEQAAGSASVHARSDIYSLGAVAYFLLTGRPPFANRTSTQMIAAHIYEAPAPVSEHTPDVDPALEAVVMRCLAKKLADRFPNVESVMTALRACPTANAWSQADALAWWRSRDAGVMAEI